MFHVIASADILWFAQTRALAPPPPPSTGDTPAKNSSSPVDATNGILDGEVQAKAWRFSGLICDTPAYLKTVSRVLHPV